MDLVALKTDSELPNLRILVGHATFGSFSGCSQPQTFGKYLGIQGYVYPPETNIYSNNFSNLQMW